MLSEDAATPRERYIENVVASISLLYFIVLIAELYIDPARIGLKYLILLDTAICIIFLAEYIFFFLKAENKRRYIVGNFIDLFSAIPFMLVFSVTPLSSMLNVFKILRGLKNFIKIYEFLIRKKVSKPVQVFSLFTMVVVYFSIVIVHLEGQANAELTQFHQGIWWAITTITTVGYGDVTPVTSGGKFAAVILMIFGIGITSAVGAVFVSYILKPFERRVEAQEKKILEGEKLIEEKEESISRTERKILKRLGNIEQKLDRALRRKKK